MAGAARRPAPFGFSLHFQALQYLPQAADEAQHDLMSAVAGSRSSGGGETNRDGVRLGATTDSPVSSRAARFLQYHALPLMAA
ncbi:hypothetical protein EJB05_20179, partial [Eragrostis curvula]